MREPLLDPPVADTAPDGSELTGYDEEHLVTYLRLLDADSDGADWQEVARIVLHIEPARIASERSPRYKLPRRESISGPLRPPDESERAGN